MITILNFSWIWCGLEISERNQDLPGPEEHPQVELLHPSNDPLSCV